MFLKYIIQYRYLANQFITKKAYLSALIYALL